MNIEDFIVESDYFNTLFIALRVNKYFNNIL